MINHPDQWAALKNDPTLVESAVEESLRYSPPVRRAMKFIEQPFTYQGMTFEAMTRFNFHFDAAGRDSDSISSPHVFDIKRKRSQPMVVFGRGRHMCLGQAVARSEIGLLLKILIDNDADLLRGGAEDISTTNFTDIKKLPVRLRS